MTCRRRRQEEEVKWWFEGLDELFSLEQGSPAYVARGQELFDWFTDQVYLIGTVNQIQQPFVVNSDLTNVPLDGGVYTFESLYTQSYLSEVWFFDN